MANTAETNVTAAKPQEMTRAILLHGPDEIKEQRRGRS